MGLFGGGNKRTVTETEFSWNQNKIKIENGYLSSEGVINFIRIPIKAIETITYSIEGVKTSAELRIIGKGVVLGELKVGLDLKDDIQDWLIQKLDL